MVTRLLFRPDDVFIFQQSRLWRETQHLFAQASPSITGEEQKATNVAEKN
jgi:hypothetical protein